MFYEKLGNNLFVPNIFVNTLLIDNSFTDSSEIKNSLTINLSYKSKQNFVDQLLSDSQYLSYIKIIVALVTDNSIIKTAKQNFNPKSPDESLASLFRDAEQTKVISLSEFTDFLEQDQVTGEYSGTYEFFFSDIKATPDMGLVFFPYVDFKSFADDNSISYDTLGNIISKFDNEIHLYQIMNNNLVQVNNVVTDMRDLTQFKNNLFTLLPNIGLINFDIINSNPSKKQYFFDLYPSFNSENTKVRLYTLFNIKSFIENFSALKKSYGLFTEDILAILKRKPIVVNITKKYSTSDTIYQVGSFTLSVDEIIRSGSVDARYHVTLENNMVISFMDNCPESSTKINYEFEIIFSDPMLKYFFLNDTNSSCVYNRVIQIYSQIQSIVCIDNPMISDAKTGKFERGFIISNNSQLKNTVNLFVDNFISLLNLFSTFDVKPDQITKIKNLLDIERSTIFVYIDFYSFVNKVLVEIGNIFSQLNIADVIYYKKFDSIKFEVVPSVEIETLSSDILSGINATEATPAGEESMGVVYNKFNDIKIGSYTLKKENIKSTNQTSYLLKNSVIATANSLVPFSNEYDLSFNYNESEGLILKETNTKFEIDTSNTNGKRKVSINKKRSSNKLLNNSFGSTTSVSFNVPFPTETFGMSNPKDDLKNFKAKKTINESIQSSNLPKEEFIFNVATNLSTTPEDLLPKSQLEYLTFENNTLKWKVIEQSLGLSGTYFIRTSYMISGDLYSKNNIAPKIANEYRIITI